MRLTSEEKDRLIEGVLARVREFNAAAHPVRITGLVLFGSALYERASYGDVDIDFDLAFKQDATYPWSLVEHWARAIEEVLSCEGVNVHWGAVEHFECAHRVIWRCDARTGCVGSPDEDITPASEFWQPYLKKVG